MIHDYVGMIHDAGAHLHTIGSVEEACRAVDAGVDVIIAQGREAGRPVRGEIGTPALVPVVNAGTRYRSSLQAVSPTLVTAPGQSGGVPGAECGGRDVVAGGGGGGHAVAEGAGGVDDEHAADPARPHRRLRCG